MIPHEPEDHEHFWQDLISIATIFAAIVLISSIAAYLAEHHGK